MEITTMLLNRVYIPACTKEANTIFQQQGLFAISYIAVVVVVVVV
jgi:hypothetical protein